MQHPWISMRFVERILIYLEGFHPLSEKRVFRGMMRRFPSVFSHSSEVESVGIFLLTRHVNLL